MFGPRRSSSMLSARNFPKSTVSITVALLLLSAAGAAADDVAGTAQAAFDRLKALEGTWHGKVSGHDEAGG